MFWDVSHIVCPWKVKIVLKEEKLQCERVICPTHLANQHFWSYISDLQLTVFCTSLSTKPAVSPYSCIFPQAKESLCHYSYIWFTPLKAKLQNLWKKAPYQVFDKDYSYCSTDFNQWIWLSIAIKSKIAMSDEGERRNSFSSRSVERES